MRTPSSPITPQPLPLPDTPLSTPSASPKSFSSVKKGISHSKGEYFPPIVLVTAQEEGGEGMRDSL